MPSDIDAVKPSIAAGVPCPANIVGLTANPSKALVDSVAQFSAVEHMVHENISPDGTPRSRETRQFNYVVSLGETAQGGLTVDEYRDSDDLNMPGKIKTTGLAVLAVAFHPAFRNDFEMQCEGLGDWNGQAAWLVHFRQIDSKPSRLRTYVVNKNNYPVSLKGRAWIGADNLQILHLETDLVQTGPRDSPDDRTHQRQLRSGAIQEGRHRPVAPEECGIIRTLRQDTFLSQREL